MQPGTRIADNQTFFAARAATWDERFPDDAPRYARAIDELAAVAGGVALDIGCGTGRALPFLRAAVGARGTVIGLDLTVEMLQQSALRCGSDVLLQADAARLPLADRSCDAIFAAGLLHHLPDPIAGLREFARVCRPGARLALFHPIGRAALAARHGQVPHPDDVRGAAAITAAFAATGWQTDRVEDGDERYLALASLS
jgi:SAM-dependent methyltransferase